MGGSGVGSERQESREREPTRRSPERFWSCRFSMKRHLSVLLHSNFRHTLCLCFAHLQNRHLLDCRRKRLQILAFFTWTAKGEACLFVTVGSIRTEITRQNRNSTAWLRVHFEHRNRMQTKRQEKLASFTLSTQTQTEISHGLEPE